MPVTISIPHVPRDERIGSVFNELFEIIYATENSGNDIVWDFENCSFFHPFFIAPLAIYRHNCHKEIKCINICQRLSNYLNLIRFDSLLTINGQNDIRTELKDFYNRTYIPICKFDMSYQNVDGVQSVLQGIIERQAKINPAIKTPLSYMIGELVCNINEHSKSKHGYIFSQFIPSERCINICIADTGITVFGSYTDRGKYLDQIGDSEADALKMANEGFSTKERPECESRGYGISTTKKMLVDGLGGEFFMLSGGAFHRFDKNKKTYLNLPEDIYWSGSIILMKIPVSAPENFDYYDYIC